MVFVLHEQYTGFRQENTLIIKFILLDHKRIIRRNGWSYPTYELTRYQYYWNLYNPFYNILILFENESKVLKSLRKFLHNLWNISKPKLFEKLINFY